MKEELQYFRQSVAVEGYEIVTPDNVSPRYMQHFESTLEIYAPAPSLLRKKGLVKVYDPFEEPALFRIFAKLDGSDESILGFANEYGFICDNDPDAVDIRVDGWDEPIELLSVWRQKIEQIKTIVELWNHIQQEDNERLSRHIVWDIKQEDDRPDKLTRVVYYSGDETYEELLAVSGRDDDLLAHISFGNLEVPARIFLQRRINEHLQNKISPKLLFGRGWEKQKVISVPSNLISLMWLQFANSVENNLRYRDCAVCSKPFLVAPSERGKPRQFCSAACKAKNYREKRKAREASN